MVPGAVEPPRLLLASASPRRRQLLELAGIAFEAVATGAEEVGSGDPESVVAGNALRKAEAGREMRPRVPLVLGADTDVVIDGAALGKAADEGAARERLLALSGRTHQVLGAIALLDSEGRRRTAIERTAVSFASLEGPLLELYLGSGEWRDRAGAYAVQGLGAAFIERVEGDLANVIGLPLRTLLRLAPELAAGP